MESAAQHRVSEHITDFIQIVNGVLLRGGLSAPLQKSTKRFLGAWALLNAADHVEVFRDTFERHRAELLSSDNGNWIAQGDAQMRIDTLKLYLSAVYKACVQQAELAYSQTRELPDNPRALRPEIDHPLLMLMHVYSIFAEIYGYENEYTMLRRRVMVIQETLGVQQRESASAAADQFLQPMMGVFDMLLDTAISARGVVPEAIADGLSTLRRNMHGNQEADALSRLMSAMTQTMSSAEGQQAYAHVRDAISSEPAALHVMDTMLQSTNMQDAMQRVSTLTQDPNLMNTVKQRLSEAVTAPDEAVAQEVRSASESQGDDILMSVN